MKKITFLILLGLVFSFEILLATEKEKEKTKKDTPETATKITIKGLAKIDGMLQPSLSVEIECMPDDRYKCVTVRQKRNGRVRFKVHDIYGTTHPNNAGAELDADTYEIIPNANSTSILFENVTSPTPDEE